MKRAQILLTSLLIGVVLSLLPPLRQDENYQHFADQRVLFRVPNFWNVVSNAPFALVGILGLLALSDLASRILFAGVFLTASALPIITGRLTTHVSCGIARR